MKFHTLFKEPSTWRGLVWLLTAAGVTLNPEQQAGLITLGMAVAGFMGLFFIDQPKDLTAQGHHETTGPDRPVSPADPPEPVQSSERLFGKSHSSPLDETTRPHSDFNDR